MEHDQHGFDVHPDVFSPDETSAVLVALQHARGRSRAGVRHLMSEPVVSSLANDTRLLALARRVLGTEPVPYRATLFDKSPKSNWLVAWHQDTAVPVRARREVSGWGPWSLKSGNGLANRRLRILSVAMRSADD